MHTAAKIIKYELHDVVRSKWVAFYGVFFLLLTEGLLRFGGGEAKALLSLVNVVLMLIPLVGVLFGAMYLYNAREFIEMLLAQPVDRRSLFGGMYLGLALPLALGFAVGVGVPFAVRGGAGAAGSALALLLALGVGLTFIFVALAFLLALGFEDRVKGLGAAVLVWLGFTVLYDGGVLLFLSLFAGYPLETPVLALMLLNPVDLARVALLMSFDVAALMGYTGALFQRFFGGTAGPLVAAGMLLLWLIAPFLAGLRCFVRRDF
ncbi:ABC transporter permease subunit [Rhodocaloribacter litoris]|uniref:ABC transporter permease subunit n=1 Tax=Rhodocaloribacter litoris TaxID=2558931 RepID=UPI00141F0BC5|nr:ABC transporter permease subunit [Rhodocaloribacter litoris]QXD15996.1 ABC transporter permease subunit [Rhodocaloribacter litoris]